DAAAVAQIDEMLEYHRSAGPHRIIVMRFGKRSIRLWKYIGVALEQHLTARTVEQCRERVVHQHPAMLAVLYEHRLWQRVDQPIEELVCTLRLELCLFAFGDIDLRAVHAQHAAELVALGLCAREDPAIAAVLVAQPEFELESAMGIGEDGGLTREHGRALFRMQARFPALRMIG